MAQHRHRAVAGLRRERIFWGCVARDPRHDDRAHGGIEILDTCRCGFRRRSNHNVAAVEYGPWEGR